MRWQTETRISPFPFSLGHKDQMLLLGSCFSENMGNRLAYFKFNTCQNPLGIIYNPLSLLHNVRVLASEKLYTPADLKQSNGVYFSYDHHSRYSAASADQTLENINTSLTEARESLPNTNVAFITLGTAFYWWLKDGNRVVNNCHKQPGKWFEQRKASVNEVRSALAETVVLLQKRSPGIEVVFTISPIRHLKHGSVGNQLSKSTLIVAAQELAAGLAKVHYFPSYELVLDDLRDYRWYEEDLIHPNKMATDYIWERFGASLLNENTLNLLPQIDQAQKMLKHRPMLPGSAQTHLKRLEKFVKPFENSGIDFTQEIADWKAKYA